ncbi:hypothetical protein LNO89_04730 [Klebsiella pneumoniae subsp. pneumoniae]|nr:hypothetical protein [Klebsiella pneumoniae subsp. pneumoniae]
MSKPAPFALNEPYYGNSASLKLLTPTQDSRDIIAAATSCLDAIWKAGHRYQKAGVMLGDFYSQGRRPAESVRRACSAAQQRQTDAGSRSAECEKRQGALYFAGQGSSSSGR